MVERESNPLSKNYAGLEKNWRKASALVGALQMETGIRLKALRLPLADLERRIAAFDEAVSRFEAERRAAADFLAGDRLRAFAELEQDAEKLRIQGRETLISELDRTLGGGAEAEQARAALAATMIQYFDAALAQTISEVGKRLATTLHAHQDRADKLVAAVRRSAADLLEISFQAPESSDSLEVRHDPFWVTSANRTARRHSASRPGPVSSPSNAPGPVASTAG